MSATTPPTTRPSRLRKTAAWTFLGLLALFFLSAGLPKLLGLPSQGGTPEDFARWGYPAWFRAVVGAGETLGALLLVVPRLRVLGAPLRFWGAAGLSLDMAGALATHLRHGELAMAGLPVVLLLATAIVAYRNRPRAWARARATSETHVSAR